MVEDDNDATQDCQWGRGESFDADTAQKVGARHGEPVVLRVRAKEMHARGFKFFLSANLVWLTERVPVEWIEFPE